MAPRSLGANPAQGQAAKGMSAEDEAQEGDQTELPADTFVVYLFAETAKLRTQQRNMFKNILTKNGIDHSRVKFTANNEHMPLICNRVAVGWKEADKPCQCHLWSQWLPKNTQKWKHIQKCTDSAGVQGSVAPGDNVLFWRQGQKKKGGGMMARCWRCCQSFARLAREPRSSASTEKCLARTKAPTTWTQLWMYSSESTKRTNKPLGTISCRTAKDENKTPIIRGATPHKTASFHSRRRSEIRGLLSLHHLWSRRQKG